jgi:PAS domain S-box-containing protein
MPDDSSTGSIDAASGALFRAAPVPAYVYDVETMEFLEVNAAAVERYGWSREEFLRMNLVDIRPPGEEERLRDHIARNDSDLDRAGVWRHLTKAGEALEVEIQSHTLEFHGRRAKLVFVHDVTARLRYERSLVDTTDRFRALVQALPGVVFLVDEDGLYLEGAGGASLLAIPVENAVGKHLQELFGVERVHDFLGVIHRALETGRPLDHSYELEVPNGRVWFEARVSPLRTRINGRRAVVWTAWDVTERHRATQALRESETRFRTILDSEPECVKVIDRNGRLESMNRAGLRILGVESMDQIGDVMRFVAPHDREAFVEMVRAVLKGADRKLAFDAIRQDGTPLRLESTAVPLRDASGTIVAALAITRDVTEARRLSRAFEQQAELLRSIFDFIPIMIGVLDEDGRLTFPNRALAETLGWKDDEEGRAPRAVDAIFGSSKAGLEAEQFFAGQSPGWREFDVHAPDGTALRAAWAVVTLSDGRRMLIGQDVTEQRRLETQAWQSQKLESLGRLAGGVAHDFNNMLTVILGYIELMILRGVGDATTREDIENIQQAAMRARDLTAQLLAFGRRQVTRRRLTAPESVVEGITPLMRRVLGEAIALELRSSAEGALIFADPAQIEQILMNLVLNAKDAMPEGGRVTVDLSRIDAGADAPPGVQVGPCVLLSVSDSGHGMDQTTLDRVFEPFFSTKGLGAGTGLGLATAYGAVKQNGGHIFASSKPGVGTTFELYFPVAEGKEEEPKTEKAVAATTQGKGEVVLLVEDDDTVREFLHRVLSRAGYQVLAAASVGEAMRVAGSAASIDLVLTDVVMTDGSGLDVVRGIEEIHPRARKLLASGYAESDAVRKYLLDPAVNFLQKPFSPEALLRRVSDLLAGG